MGISIAIGTLIGAAIAKAGVAAAAVGAGTVATVGTGAVATTAASGVAGALGTAGAFVGSHAAAFGTLALAGLSVGSKALAYRSQSGSRDLQLAQLELQQESERAQRAIEGEARQRNLRRVLATQNAVFGSSNVDMGTGTPSVIAGETFNEVQRQENQAQIFSSARQSILGMQRSDILASGRSQAFGTAVNAAGSLLNFGLRTASRGAVPKVGSTVGVPAFAKDILQ